MEATTRDRDRPPKVDVVERVLRWRVGQLRRGGYPDELAAELAARSDIDLHSAIELVRRGCPPETATRILV